MKNKKLIAAFVAVLILLFPLNAAAEEIQSENKTLNIDTVDDLLEFAEKCRMDSYSKDLSVVLNQDLDLTGAEFMGIPIFCGQFDGGGHTISGLHLSQEGTVVGFFRYLTDSANVRNLNLSGEIIPRGTRGMVGSIAGSNAGLIQECTFSGKIAGGDYVGGLVGENRLTGIIEMCSARGQVNGVHFVGGLAGNNIGVIRECDNSSAVNITSQQNNVHISDITMEAITNSESINTVTDIGGIAGVNSGVIRNCKNNGDVGYLKMGYNVGGIAGNQRGYITECQNSGEISGRKEIGGIAGQMEPVTNIEYSIDTLQILQKQLETMGTLTDRAVSNAREGAEEIVGSLQNMGHHVGYAWDAVEELLDEPGDLDSILAAESVLSGALGSIEGSMNAIAESAYGITGTLSSDVNAITNQIHAMEKTIDSAGEHLGGSITDISDQDTPEDFVGKVSFCTNYGDIVGDQNLGGISGAIALENDLDPEADITFSGNESLNFDGEFRAVILSCRNAASVMGSKQNVGGIVGWMYLGLVKDSTNTGTLSAEKADYVGGVVGRSTGFVRQCYAKCEILGNHYVGGICGTADEITDCCAMTKVRGIEKTGAVLGHTATVFTQEENSVDDNFYMTVGNDIGAIDGISYSGIAEPLESQAFLKLNGLPKEFQSFRVYFQYENGGGKMLHVNVGERLENADIPPIPEKSGYVSHWDGLNDGVITFDTVIHAVYTPLKDVLQSENENYESLPKILAEGSFLVDAELEISGNAANWSEDQQTLDSVRFLVPQSETEVTIRYRIPENAEPESLCIMRFDQDGTWKELDFETDGSYLVFKSMSGENQIVVLEKHNISWLSIAAVVMAMVLVLGAVFWLKKRK